MHLLISFSINSLTGISPVAGVPMILKRVNSGVIIFFYTNEFLFDTGRLSKTRL